MEGVCATSRPVWRPAPAVFANRQLATRGRARYHARPVFRAVSTPSEGVWGIDTGASADPTRQLAAKAALELEQRGWTMIEGVVSKEDCAEYVDSVWLWLESLGTGIKR